MHTITCLTTCDQCGKARNSNIEGHDFDDMVSGRIWDLYPDGWCAHGYELTFCSGDCRDAYLQARGAYHSTPLAPLT